MVSAREEGTSGHWAVGRERGGRGGPRGWPALAVVCTPAPPPRLPSLGQERVMLLLVCTTPSQNPDEGCWEGSALCPGSSAQCAMGTRRDPEREAGRDRPTASLVGCLLGAEAGTCRVVLRPEVPGGLDGGGHNCRGAERSAAVGHKCTPVACEYLTRPNKSPCIINQAGSRSRNNLSS